MADKPDTDPRHVDRAAELARQDAVRKAVAANDAANAKAQREAAK